MGRRMNLLLIIYILSISIGHGYCWIYSDGKEPVGLGCQSVSDWLGCLTITCQNGGQLIADTCTCLCQPGYSGNFCQQELKSSQWPSAKFAIPASMFGCPEPDVHGWSMSFINLSLPLSAPEQVWNDNDLLTLEPHILGPYYKHSIQLNFCNREPNGFDEDGEIMKWENGNYCIYKTQECPEDFNEGSVVINGYIVTNKVGRLHAGERTWNSSSVVLFFCCREDSSESEEINLPATFPFNMFKGPSAQTCQLVKDMEVKEDVFFMVNHNKDWEFYPPHPNISFDSEEHIGIPFCFYYPKARRECYYEMDDGFSYNGKVNQSVNDGNCQQWTSIDSIYEPSRWWVGEFEDNFCRKESSDNMEKPFCYVNNTKEICDIPKCQEELGIEEAGRHKPIYHVNIHLNHFGKYAVDGIIDTDTFRSGRPILKPWFQIDLEEYYEVHAIMVYRTKIWIPINFRGVGTYVSKHQWDFLNYGAIRCDDLRFPRKARKYRFQCKRPIIGQFVTVRNFDFTDEDQNPYFYLSFQEIQVFRKRTMCGRPLGLITGDIREFQIESSTRSVDFLPEYGTLYRFGNGWCSDVGDNSPWFMVDLIIPHVVQGVLLQGWTVSQQTKFIDSFTVSYGINISKLFVYEEIPGISKVFLIDDTRAPESTQRFLFLTDMVTRYVRLDITSYNIQACLKLEIIGCPKRGIRDFWCGDGSIDLGYEAVRFHDFWMEETSPGPHVILKTISLAECIVECKLQSCVSASYSGVACVLHDGHRYNKQFNTWFVVTDSDVRQAIQRLCYKGFYNMDECGGDIYVEGNQTVYIDSPGYPLHYGQGARCTWNVHARKGKSVRLDVIDIQIPAPVTDIELKENRLYELNAGFCKDTITISSSVHEVLSINSDNYNKYIGSMMISSGNTLRIHLASCYHYKSIKYQNFAFKVSEEDSPGCGMTADSFRKACTKQSSMLASPRYPTIYDGTESCFWEINGHFGQYVSFQFLLIDIPEVDATCTQSHVAIYDVSLNGEAVLMGQYCTQNIQFQPIISSWHNMKIEFNMEYEQERGTGFLGKYQLVNFTQSYGDILDTNCGEDWHMFERSCYKMFSLEHNSSVVEKGFTWREALQDCHLHGGFLLNIGTIDEMQFIHYLLTNVWRNIGNSEAYIGLTKIAKGGSEHYEWSDGSPLSFTAWYKDPSTLISQPDGLLNERCTKIHLYSIHTMDDWHDVACAYDKVYNYICEKSRLNTNVSKDDSETMVKDVKFSMTNRTQISKPFECNSREHVSSVYICDGVNDCYDGSDEISCGDECSDIQFTCTNGGCISLSQYCDFRPDCEDLSDEKYCVRPNCSETQWTCDNRQCIDIEKRCDLKFDCIDHSDERNCDKCKHFQCYDATCILESRVCDRQIDCTGRFMEDEKHNCINNVQASCSEWWSLGERQSGEYIVSFGLKDSSTVYCDFDSMDTSSKIYTIVHHKQEQMAIIHKGGMDTEIQYSATLEHMLNLKKMAKCSQHIKLICHYTHSNAYWYDAQGNKHSMKTNEIQPNCSCPFVEKCEPDKIRCNCDTSTWMDWYENDQNDVISDEGFIETQEYLPISRIVIPNSDSSTTFIGLQIGPLVCTEDLVFSSDNLLCRSGITVNSDILCLLDFDEFGEMKGCRDMSHLDNCEKFNCPPGFAKCTDSYCIPLRLLCDKTQHCKDGADERSCDSYNCPGFFHCRRSKICLTMDQVCDGTAQCPQEDDEYLCNQSCPESCQCDDLKIACKTPNITDRLLHQIPSNIRHLDISTENFALETANFKEFTYLVELNLSRCRIENLHNNLFFKLNNLEILDLSYNRFSVLLSFTFDGLWNLKYLNLEGNVFTKIFDYAFSGLHRLPSIHIFGSKVSSIQEEFVIGLRSLQYLNLTKNNVFKVADGAFANLTNLISLDIRHNNIRKFSSNIFQGLNSLEYLYTDEYVFCCLRPPNVPAENCLPQPDEFSSCSDLMRMDLLRWSLWIIGLSAFAGNVFVLVYRIITDRKTSLRSHSLLIYNLSFSDLLMGVYLLIIASADLHYRGRYIWNDFSWRNGWLCTFAGVLSTISSEASVMYITLITIDRFIAVKFPFGQIKFTIKHAKISAAVVWVIVLVTGILPTLSIGYFDSFYSRSAVCLAFPLTRNRPSGWEYSTAIFIFLNFALFCLIAIGQLMIYLEVVSASKSIKSQRRNRDLAVARSLFLVVITDFLCWFPLGVMGLMALSGRAIPSEVYAWTAVFILPINSALNPFLYTFSAILKQRRNVGNSSTRTIVSEVSENSGSRVAEVFSNPKLIIGGERENPTTKLKEYIEGNNVTIQNIYAIIFNCIQELQYLHERELCHGSFSEYNVYLIENENEIEEVLLQVTPKMAFENQDMAADIMDLGCLVKLLLRAFQNRRKDI